IFAPRAIVTAAGRAVAMMRRTTKGTTAGRRSDAQRDHERRATTHRVKKATRREAARGLPPLKPSIGASLEEARGSRRRTIETRYSPSFFSASGAAAVSGGFSP